jgi:putative MATE family efflux protein
MTSPVISAVASTATPAAKTMAPRTRLMLETPVLPTLLRLSLPNVMNLLAFVGLITFDGLFVGRLGPEALAGVTLVFPWVMLIQHTAASGMGGGVTSAVARALGAGNRERADALAYHAFLLALAMGAAFSAVLLAISPIVFRWMGGRDAMLAAAFAYSNVAFSGAIAICLLNTLANVVRGTGNMTLPAAAIIGSVIGHIMLSPALIFGVGPMPPLGPAGAGWGLVISFTIGSSYLFWHLRSGRSPVTLRLTGVVLRWDMFVDILKVGIPGLFNVAITNLTVVVMTGVAASIGVEAAVAYGMGARLEYILIPLAFGFGTSIVAMVGTNWGAKQYQRARRIAWTGGATVALACGVVGVFFAVLPELWMGLFSRDETIVRLGASYLRTVGPFYVFYGLGMALYFATQGLGSPVFAVAANALRLAVGAGAALLAIRALGADEQGLFWSIALGFLAYGLATALALSRVKIPRA